MPNVMTLLLCMRLDCELLVTNDIPNLNHNTLYFN